MDFAHSFPFSSLLTILLIDFALAGDNAIAIALAVRHLPHALQTRAVFWGTLGAIAVRILMTVIVVYLLKLPGLMMVGGLLLLPVAWKLIRQDQAPRQTHMNASFREALRMIIVADALMGLDNTLAVAGASKGHFGLVISGLLISIPLVMWGSKLILKWLVRFPIIVFIGAGVIAFTAARMITYDTLLTAWLEAHRWIGAVLDILLVTGICGGGWLINRRRQRHTATSRHMT